MRFTGWGVVAATFAALLTSVVAAVFSTPAARAMGTVTIQQADGGTNVYHDVVIKIINGALFMTSADGKGTLVIHKAACSYQGELMVCFATSATLVQAGQTSPLDFKDGTVYVNTTGDSQQLSMSTTKVPPHSVLVSFTTKRGTYVSVSGRIDKTVK